MATKQELLAKELGVNVEDIKNGYRDNVFEVVDEDREYLVVDEGERYEEVSDYIESLWDELGLESFTPAFKTWILDNCIEGLADLAYQDVEEVVWQMTDEEVADACIEEGIAETHEVYDENSDVDNPQLRDDVDFDSLRGELIKKRADKVDDSYFEDMFGTGEEYSKFIIDMVDKGQLQLDFQKMIRECVEQDGYGHFLSGYDGKEIELKDDNGEVLYAYRTN